MVMKNLLTLFLQEFPTPECNLKDAILLSIKETVSTIIVKKPAKTELFCKALHINRTAQSVSVIKIKE